MPGAAAAAATAIIPPSQGPLEPHGLSHLCAWQPEGPGATPSQPLLETAARPPVVRREQHLLPHTVSESSLGQRKVGGVEFVHLFHLLPPPWKRSRQPTCVQPVNL